MPSLQNIRTIYRFFKSLIHVAKSELYSNRKQNKN